MDAHSPPLPSPSLALQPSAGGSQLCRLDSGRSTPHPDWPRCCSARQWRPSAPSFQADLVHEDRDGDGRTDLIHQDVDGDGVLDLVSAAPRQSHTVLEVPHALLPRPIIDT